MPIRPLVDRTYLEQVLLSRFSHGEVQQWVQKYFQPYRELMSYYRCAMMQSSMSSTRSCRFSMTATR